MTVYCAFLRGINVNGVKMNMQELAAAFKAMGFLDAVTVLGTGNVVFSARSDVKALKILIEHGLSRRFSYSAHIFLRSASQLMEITERAKLNSVPKDYHQYFLICDDMDAVMALKQFYQSVPLAEYETLVTMENGLLWQVPKGETLNSAFGKEALGKKYTAVLTSRNISTINKVYARMNPHA